MKKNHVAFEAIRRANKKRERFRPRQRNARSTARLRAKSQLAERERTITQARSDFWRGFIRLCFLIVALVLSVSLFNSIIGKSVESRHGSSAGRMLGSIHHDAQLEEYGADGRATPEKARIDLMTYQ
jgi:hypothetical protein